MTVDPNAHILRDLKKVRVKIKRGKESLDGLYAQQTALVVAGDAAGYRAVDLARAAEPDAPKALAESFGQTIRKAKAATAKK